MKALLSFILFVSCCYPLAAQDTAKVIIPKLNDKYTDYVKKLEAGETDIDYVDFRDSYIHSEQFRVPHRSAMFDSLRKEMYSQMEKANYPAIIKITKQMLSIDYTSMLAHKILQQTYKLVGDSTNNKKYKAIEFGLLRSIVKNGDGKTCETAWEVVQVAEEYFILDMLGAELISQHLDTSGKNMCDEMKVKTSEGKKTYYFGVSKVFSTYKE